TSSSAAEWARRSRWRSCRTGNWSGCAGVVAESAQVGHLDRLSEGGRVDHERAAQGDPDVVNAAGGAEEHQVTREQRGGRQEQGAGVVLGLRGAGQADSGGLVGGVGESGTVEARVAVAAPDVGLA